MILSQHASLSEKLKILSDAAKYDVACTSSGSDRRGARGRLGNCVPAGICHSFSADGRCISLLKILFTNECVFDCRYCINRSSNDVPRASLRSARLLHADRGILPQELYRGAFPELRNSPIPGLYHGASGGDRLPAAHPIPFPRIYPSEGHSGRQPGAHRAGRLLRGPHERQSGTGHCGGSAESGAP